MYIETAMTLFLLTAAYSYLLGSIPFGYILVRTFRGQDVRQTGSGNIGATNVSRTSPRLGALTLVLDALKGLSAVLLTRELFPTHRGLMFAAALFAVVGHVFPVWLRLRGGKGVATGLGSFAILTPKTILVVIAVFIFIFLVFRYVSLASILSVALFPLLAWILEPGINSRMVGAMTVASLIIIARHYENIRRLLNHTESRFQWRRT
ncbi:MAG TPA: glycerol-3-phosphate 1-O-acyltransferase PlsY [Terriglobales bacterium]|nr:glycerol-3-phosphate 1-O-acyltransferase PlsY [Terriglobales bacterium]